MLFDFKKNLDNILWYIALPVFCIIIVFPMILKPWDFFIGGYQDSLSNIIQYIFLEQHPFAKWNNQWIMGGFPEIASPFSDRYYPLSFPFYFLTKSIFVINLVILIHLFIAYLATFKLGSLITENKYLLSIGAILYVFSGIMMSRVSIGQNYYVFALAWIPLLYYFFLLIIWKRDIRLINFLCLIITSVLIFFSAGIYYFVFSLMLITIFLLYYLIKGKISKKVILALFCSLGLFLLLVSFKLVPDIFVSNLLIRLDPIDPLSGGGFVERHIASFIFGTPIENFYGMHESMAFIGLIPVIFIIISLIFGDTEITVPAFFSIIFAFIWASGQNTILYFIHLLPFLASFRAPGRIFGALMPIFILLFIYGIIIVGDILKGNKKILLSSGNKKNILYGIAILFIIKILEIPYQAIIPVESMIALIILIIFLVILYTNRFSSKILIYFLIFSLLISIVAALFSFNIVNIEIFVKVIILGAIFSGLLAYFFKGKKFNPNCKILCIIIVIGLLLNIAVNISYVSVTTPDLQNSPAKEITRELSSYSSANEVLWIQETGWPYLHLDFTYWITHSNMAPIRGYYAYYLYNYPAMTYQIDNKTYFISDYIIDTGSLENGQQNLPESSFSIAGIDIFKPEYILPTAFVARDNRIIQGKIMLYTPDKIILQGDFKKGDIVILKSAYYPGWKINGIESVNVQNLVGNQLQFDTSEIVITFDPLDFKIGCILSIIGIIIFGTLIYYRKRINSYLCPSKNSNNNTLKENS